MLEDLKKIMGAECKIWFAYSKSILEFIGKQAKEKHSELWKFVIENFGIVPKSDLKIDDVKDYRSIWRSWVNKLENKFTDFIREVERGDYEPEEVVAMLQKNLNNIKKKEGKIVFLSVILQYGDPVIPYFKIKYPTLSGKDIEKMPESVRIKAVLMRELLSVPTRFKNNIDRNRAIMQIIDSEKNKKHRLLLLSKVTMLLEKRSRNRIISIGLGLSSGDDFLSDLFSGSGYTPFDCQNCDKKKICTITDIVMGMKAEC